MYRTDKKFMRDPATALARIYIGNLSETVVPDNLEEKFKVYGKVLGLVLQRGFGFIQFENESQAKAAIEAEHGTTFYGRKIIVREVLENKAKKVINEQSNIMNTQPVIPSPQKPQAAPVTKSVSEPEPPVSGLPQADINDLSLTDKRGNKRKFWPRNERPVDQFRDVPPYYEEPYPPYPSFVPPPMNDRPERNDCEIIVVSKALTEYAEYIEQKLKSKGLIVDLLFPNEDVPIGRVLANISSRGCLYAILVMPQNEEHRSLTLNILHGIPQEHRNMPIEDAIILLTRNFEAYMKGEMFEKEGRMASLAEKHPEAIQMLLNLLAENRLLTAIQYDRIIKYLQDRRELQKAYEGDEDCESKREGEPDHKQAELQSRIMNILNKSASDSPKPVTPTTQSGPTPLLNDPSVQKALDSLLSGDMFKSISAGI
ncbi:RNA recognition motif [Popillia japonica]|uniref:RNA recognition motif n=1 Tax=Popillia japonica TaxID=7064 RepID=A0AAW1MHS8_POPJA